MLLVAVVSFEGNDKDGDDVFFDFIDEARGFVNPATPVAFKVALKLLDFACACRGMFAQFFE